MFILGIFHFLSHVNTLLERKREINCTAYVLIAAADKVDKYNIKTGSRIIKITFFSRRFLI